MQRIDPAAIRRLLNDGTPTSEGTPPLSPSYGAAVAEQLMKLFAGNPTRPSETEFKLMVATWTEALQDVVPERRLAEAFVHARQTRNSSFLMDVSEVCGAWTSIRNAERNALPRIGRYDYRGKSVCPDCNNTGTKLIVKRDPILQRDYTYGVPCEVTE